MRKKFLTVILFISLMLLVNVAMVSSKHSSCRGSNHSVRKLLKCVTLEGVREHQAALQTIADANNGIRTSGTPGYDQSAFYVAIQMAAAGYEVTVQPFEYLTFIELSPTVLEKTEPAPVEAIETRIMSFSGSGDVTASVSTVSEITGCDPADFTGFPAGDIALISRGACTFAQKATNAYDAGAVGVIIYNNTEGNLNGTLSSTFALNIPVTAVTQDVGQTLAATEGLVMHLQTDTFRGMATTYNVFAETKTGRDDSVVMVGAHLDSVNAGPGINDNGSGSAVLLEIAEQMSRVKPRNKVRFAWWGAEESGLVGSTYYVDNLTQEEIDDIALYLNFDMVGSPNPVFFIYDGDDSDGVGAPAGPPGSAEIEQKFEEYYEWIDAPYKGTDFSGRSDYGPFIAVGIPSGGLFTGAEGIKTAEEVEVWGGTEGDAYDPCYHQACDTFDNVSLDALDINADAAAYVTLKFAKNTSAIENAKAEGFVGAFSTNAVDTHELHDHHHSLVTE